MKLKRIGYILWNMKFDRPLPMMWSPGFSKARCEDELKNKISMKYLDSSNYFKMSRLYATLPSKKDKVYSVNEVNK